MDLADPALAALAAAYGVATGYQDAHDRPVAVSATAVRRVLELMGVDTADAAAALDQARTAPWRRLSPASVVVKASAPRPVVLRLPARLVASVRGGPEADAGVDCELELGDGGGRVAVALGAVGERREIDGEELAAVLAPLPPGLPLGDHTLRVRAGGRESVTQVVAVPDRVPEPTDSRPGTRPRRPDAGVPGIPGDLPSAALGAAGQASASRDHDHRRGDRMWGWMAQLYALRSAGSWGIGDYADLAQLAAWSGSAAGGRADVLLVNPLHAAAPTLPVQPSPYYPTSRRFLSPLYLRPEHIPEYAAADEATRAAVDGYAAAARKSQQGGGTESLPAGRARATGVVAAGPAVAGDDEFGQLIDRDAAWEAKQAALELLFAVPAPAAGAGAEGDDELSGFATWCALAERHGPDWRRWPAGLRDRDPAAVAEARRELADRVAFHRWLQDRCEEQVAAAQAAALAAGMRVGVVHDLAVGVDPAGADTWAGRDAYAAGASIGAPPDTFNQQGQDWGLPPWRPDRLAASGYAPLRSMVAAVLARGGGLRVDHILGLFRLWWIPVGAGAANGTFVRYDAEAMLGVIALEAARAGAVIVGEDLGTVESTVATTLAGAGVLGSSVLWFENDADGVPLPPSAWRERTMASVTTHDLPTAAGFLLGEHVRARADRGLLGRPVADETADWRVARDRLLAHLRFHGLLTEDGATAAQGTAPAGTADGDELDPALVRDAALGMHRLLVATPARIILAAPGDAVGDRHQPNLPGTVDSYPNWRLPVRDDRGVAVTIEDLMTDTRVARLVDILSEVSTARPPATT
ncbi:MULTISPECIES: 4-alpha-glucanotransferase [unclassified Pseudofrankia]|uniref:4-alpha-glucanotransferase n=1 Tax=unclassified Pseudofrankia TaxID=2994372 RepID=UPI0008D96726|nr:MULTISPECIES: 4-alpha-glucanotransferase [unclassified Pseudofrankia]MDT3440500.1 4-alpha-glucanotransferase [Pseudofrankia sp. BMG5.37]OHV47532.1 4-alpha-glucanotransferase [Pseudofrankia sp. BMG5.36]